MNNTEVQLILNRLDSIDKNQENHNKSLQTWISKVELKVETNRLKCEKEDKETNKRINSIGLRVAGFSSFFGVTGILIGAWLSSWINKNI